MLVEKYSLYFEVGNITKHKGGDVGVASGGEHWWTSLYLEVGIGKHKVGNGGLYLEVALASARCHTGS